MAKRRGVDAIEAFLDAASACPMADCDYTICGSSTLQTLQLISLVRRNKPSQVPIYNHFIMNALLTPTGRIAPGAVAPFTPLTQGAHRGAIGAPAAELRATSSLPRSRRDRCVMAQAAVATKEKTAAATTATPIDAPFDVSRTLLLQGGPPFLQTDGWVRSPL